MEFKVKNYRGISDADIELSKLTLICGRNSVGKTSLIDAIRSVATAESNPFKEVTKKEISMFVRSGTPSGFAEIIDGDAGRSRIDWPKCAYATKGSAVSVSTVASGIRSLVDMSATDRINYIIDMMKASPTDADLILELKNISGLFKPEATIGSTELFKRLWQGIEVNGWDAVFKQAREKGVKLKAKWELVADVKKYGSKIAEQYTPAAWTPDLETIEESVLIDDVNKAREWSDAAAKETTISDYEVERLTVLAGQIPAIEKKQKLLTEQQNVVEGEMNKKKSRLRTLESSGEKLGLVCPECQQPLALQDGALVKISKSEHKTAGKNKAEIEQLKKDIASLDEQNKILISDFGAERAALKVSKDAELKLKKIDLKKDPAGAGKVEEVLNKLKLAEDRLDAFKTKKAADKIARDILLNKKLCDVLAPAGLRNKKLTKAIEKLNKSMRVLTDSAGWDPVELNESCEILANGVPYGRLIAKSERYRARVLLQLMTAIAEKARFVIIDDTDELVKGVRNDLMKIILKSQIDALVVTALDKRDEVPDLSSINGRAYWIEGGRIA